MGESALADPKDGARSIEIVCVSGKSASWRCGPDPENLESNQSHAPGRRRRFYLAVLIGVAFLSGHLCFLFAKLSELAPSCDAARRLTGHRADPSPGPES
jgi:hypothetical protein